jgi:dienelactone hydrolase
MTRFTVRGTARQFEYDSSTPLDIQCMEAQEKEGVRVESLTYRGPGGGRITAFLVVPGGRGPFPAILWGHWAMPGSSVRNRGEFLEEAKVLARAGALSLLPDAPFTRSEYGNTPVDDPFSAVALEMQRATVVEFRRAIDLLLAREDVDAGRTAYVGHSYNATTGAILARVEKRIHSFVLMAGVLAYQVGAWADEPELAAWRQKLGEEKVRRLLAETQWADPGTYLPYSGPAAVFIQAARIDGIAGEKYANDYFEVAGEPKKLGIYDAPHALNAAARLDRVRWLAERLSLGEIVSEEVAAIPETR